MYIGCAFMYIKYRVCVHTNDHECFVYYRLLDPIQFS